MNYEDFLIQLGPRVPDGLLVKASCTLGGDETGRLDPALDPGWIHQRFPTTVRQSVQRHAAPLELGEIPELQADEIGDVLFRAIFRAGIRSVFDRSLGRVADDPDRGLRIKLRIDLRDESQASYQSLPWELLFRSDTASFLGLSRRSPIVRYLEVPQEIRSRPLPDRIRVLVLAPDAKDLPPINLLSERRNLQALERRVKGLEVEILPSADLGSLRSALLDREVHVLHFMGHGDFDRRSGEGVLCFEDGSGHADLVSARDLVQTLRDFQDLRLVVLNACNTGRTDPAPGANPFSSIAPAFMQAGIPAVLAMQLPISDDAAVTFSEALYRRLGAGDPVDAAVTEGRLAISRMDRRSAEWAVPALFMRVPHGALFVSAPRAESGGWSTHPGRPEATWRGHLRIGNYASAEHDLRQELALDPMAARAAVGLVVALARGASLKTLKYSAAMEAHRLLAGVLSQSGDHGLAALCLIAVKVDYFRANAVREAKPTLDEVLRVAAASPIQEEDREVLDLLNISHRTREVFSRVALIRRRPS